MDLGKIKFRRYGTNWLNNAINKKYGLLWSDGCRVLLTKDWSNQENQLVKTATTVILGDFNNVDNVGWSSTSSQNPVVTVIHRTSEHELPTITLWKLSRLENEINLTKTHEFVLSVPPLSQGFLWDSLETFLVVPCKRSACVYRFIPGDCTDSYVNVVISIPSWCPPKSVFRGSACTTTKLYLAMETHILVFDLTAIDGGRGGEMLSPVVTIDICHVRNMLEVKDFIVCASELPARQLLAGNQQEDDFNGEGGALDSLRNIASQQSEGCKSGISLCLLSKAEGTVLHQFAMKGIMTPDLLAGNQTTGHFVVGSTSGQHVQVFSLVGKKAMELKKLQIDPGERARGVDFFGTKLVLACTSHQEENTLVPVTDFVERNMIIKIVAVSKTPNTLKIENCVGNPSSSSSSPGRRSASCSEGNVRRIPLKNIQQSSLNAYVDNANVLTDELIQNLTDKLKVSLRQMSGSTQREGYKSSPETPRYAVGTGDEEHLVSITCAEEDQSGRYNRDEPYCRSPVNSLQVETSRCASIEEVRFYSDISHAEWINVHCHNTNNTTVISENVLLEPGGRLQLSALQKIFQLINVKILIEDSYCHIPLCTHGYIPILFKHRQVVHVTGSTS